MTLMSILRHGGAGRGALWIIAMLMVGSAAIRLGAGPGAALANGLMNQDKTNAAEERSELSTEFAELLDSVRSREAAVAELERELSQRARTLDLAEEEIRLDLQELEAAEARLLQVIGQVETASEGDLSRLTSVYESMKPKDAAVLFQEMSPDFAAGFIARMRPDAAAALMAGLKPEAAYSISVVLAGRNAQAPTQ